MTRTPLIALATCLAAAWPAQAHEKHHHSTQTQSMQVREVQAVEERLPLPNLPVTDSHGARSGFRDRLPAGPVILSFTYTECDTLCGISNAVLSMVDAELGAGEDRRTTIVTVAIDPERDTPEALRAEAEAIGAGPDWIWLTGGPRGTRPLLEALRFPPGALEDHDPMFLVGQPCLGRFTRVVGLADPDALIALARTQPECGG